MPNICSGLDCPQERSTEALYKDLIYKDEFGCPAILYESLGAATSECGLGECRTFSVEEILRMVWSNNGILVVETDAAEPRITDCTDIPDEQTLFNEALTVSDDGNECYVLRVTFGIPLTTCQDLPCGNELEKARARFKQAWVRDSNGCTALVIAQAEMFATKYFDCETNPSIEALIQNLLVDVASTGILGSDDFVPVNGCDAPVLQVDATQCADNGMNNGSITVSASGGSGSYTYILNDTILQVDDGVFVNIGAGPYNVKVIDSEGCEGNEIDDSLPECGFLQMTLDFVNQLEIIDDETEIYFGGTPYEIAGSEIWDAFNEAFVAAAATGFTPTMWLPMYGEVVTRQIIDVIDPMTPAVQHTDGGMTNSHLGTKANATMANFWELPLRANEALPNMSEGTVFINVNDDTAHSPNLIFGAQAGGVITQINATKPIGNAIHGVAASLAASSGLTTTKAIHILSRRTLTNMKYRIDKTQVGTSAVNAGGGSPDACQLLLFGRNDAVCTNFPDLYSDNRIQGIITFADAMNDAQCDAWVDIIEQLYTRLLTWVP